MMAAVYSANEGSFKSNNESFSCKYKTDTVRERSTDPMSNSNAVNAENTTGGKKLNPGGPDDRDHAEVVATNAAAPPINIKEERVEEDDCVVVDLGEAGEEDVAGRTAKRVSKRDKNADGEWPFRSEDCSEAFGNKEAYVEHRNEHIHDGPIVCLDTDSEWDDLLVSTDGGRKTLCCALCGQKFSNSKGFFTHQLKHHNQEINPEMVRQKSYECKDCGKAFSQVGQYLNHQRSHKQASKSVFHQLAHLKKKSFQCPTCGRCYSRASALDAHRHCHEIKLVKSKSCETTDSTEKPLSLNEASVKTEDNDTPSEPADGHQQKVFQCLCGKSFRTMNGLGTHQRFSTSCSEVKVKEEIKQPFKCTECGKTFVSSVALVCHQHWHKRRSDQSHKCKECGRVFTSLTHHNRHQRIAHSQELPAKSFLHQVCQLKKKAFECQDCGRRFSRASALQSHQLCHSVIFRDVVEKEFETSPSTQAVKTYQSDREKPDNIVLGVFSQDIPQTPKLDLEKDHNCSDTQNTVEEHGVVDVEYEVVRITAPDDCESDGGLPQDLNPDLELVCESDQEEKDDLGASSSQTAESISLLQFHSEMDVKIVQIDYEHLNDQELINAGMVMIESRPQEPKKYNCPHCDRTFVKALAMRCHLLWHRRRMGRKTGRKTSRPPITYEVCGHEGSSKTGHYFHMGKHEDKVPYKSITYQLENLQKNNIKCDECGMRFSRLSALHSHQQHHSGPKKPFACLQCHRSYSTANGLNNHQKVCCGSKLDSNDAKDKEVQHFNPTKSLLGPKVHHCKKCGKGFWSLGAFYHHKQNQSQCADAEMTRPSETENGRVRRRRKGRKVRPKRELHSKEKHECEVCGKSYYFLACFLKHKLVHDTIQPAVKSFDYQVEQLKKNSYQCPDCGKVFSRAMALQFHMKSHGYETGISITESSNLTPGSEGSMVQGHQKPCLKPVDNVENPQECEKTLPNEQHASSQKVDVLKCETSHVTDSEKEQKTLLASDLKYQCKDCGRSFSVIGALNFHKRIHRKDHKSTKWKSELAKPLMVAKVKSEECLPKGSYACTECGRHFSTNSALGTHRRWHKDKKFARFLSKNNKIISKKSVDGGPYLCNLCGKGFFYLCVLRRHQMHHPPTEAQPQNEQVVKTAESNDSFSCPECQMSFSVGSLLTAHFATHHVKSAEKTEKLQSEVPPNEPSGPPMKQSSTSEMDAVKRERNMAQYHQCSHCPKSFLNVRGLRAHKWQKHLKFEDQPTASPQEHPKLFTCSACEKPYASEGALRNHKKYCSGNKKNQMPPMEEESVQLSQALKLTTKCLYKCHKCGKAFPSEEQLKVHKDVAKTRPHCCTLCCRGYWTESQLQQHLAWHNEVRRRLPTELRYKLGASIAPGPSQKPQAATHKSTSTVKQPVPRANPQHNSHKCLHCGKIFLSPRALQQHQALHKTEELYHCSLCPQTFSEIRDLDVHHQECLGGKEIKDSKPVHPGSELTCIECGSSFKRETELHQHYIEHARGVF